MLSKKLLYLQIPLNTVLWGCESWSMTEEIKRELRVFHHKAIRRILNINMFDVEKYHIKNQSVRRSFLDSHDIVDTVTQRQLKWIGKLANKAQDNIAFKILAAWSKNPRTPGKPQSNTRRTYAKVIKEIVPTLKDNGLLKTWLPVARSKDSWNDLVQKWLDSKTESLITNFPPAPIYPNPRIRAET